jgi:hypothetical protein
LQFGLLPGAGSNERAICDCGRLPIERVEAVEDSLEPLKGRKTGFDLAKQK